MRRSLRSHSMLMPRQPLSQLRAAPYVVQDLHFTWAGNLFLANRFAFFPTNSLAMPCMLFSTAINAPCAPIPQ